MDFYIFLWISLSQSTNFHFASYLNGNIWFDGNIIKKKYIINTQNDENNKKIIK